MGRCKFTLIKPSFHRKSDHEHECLHIHLSMGPDQNCNVCGILKLQLSAEELGVSGEEHLKGLPASGNGNSVTENCPKL